MMGKKGNNTWILCTSKSFPGKLYYFNVITGEAAWCLTEEEKKVIAKEGATKKGLDKSHFYPEPNTPPTEDGPNTPNICYNFTPPTNVPLNFNVGPPHIFGQPIFPRYIPNQYMPGYVMPMPQMLVANKCDPKKRSFDQVTQTSDEPVTCVQGYTMPLSKRFGAYSQVNIHTKTFRNKDIDAISHNKSFISASNDRLDTHRGKPNTPTMQGSIVGSEWNDHNILRENRNNTCVPNPNINITDKVHNSKILRNSDLISFKESEYFKTYDSIVNNSKQTLNTSQKSMLQRNGNEPEKNFSTRAMNTEIQYSKSVFNTQDQFKGNWVQNTNGVYIPKQDIQKHTLNSDDDVISYVNETDAVDNQHRYFNINDLRFLLQAKRRKLTLSNTVKTIQAKDNLTSAAQDSNNNLRKLIAKPKQVTFNLQWLRDVENKADAITLEETEMSTPDSTNMIQAHSPTQPVMNVTYLKSLAKPFVKTDPWYVVVDIGVLLDDFEFIENFVKKDITCRLLVPNIVRLYIESMSVEEYGDRSWVMLARKAVRRLATLRHRVVLQPPVMEKSSITTIDGTIECCLQVLQCNHAVLITTDSELYARGHSSGVLTFKLDDIKTGVENESQVYFDTSINVTIKNDNIITHADNIEGFGLNKNDCLPVNDTDVFKVPTTIVKDQGACLERGNVDTCDHVIHSKSNLIAGTATSNKINLNRSNIIVTKQLDVEDDIKSLGLQENTTRNNRSSENLIDYSPYLDLNVRRVVMITNTQNNKDEKNIQYTKREPQQIIIQKNIYNPPIDLGNTPVEDSRTFKLGNEANSSLTVTIPGKQQNSNPSIKEGHGLKINAYTMEDLLKRFHVKDRAMSQRIDHRLDEWMCCFYQIMEECLSEILMTKIRDKQNILSAPWSLLEAVICVKQFYSDDTAIKAIAEKFATVLSHLSVKHDKLKNDIKPVDFMRLFACGVLLVESLKDTVPQSAQVVESEKLLDQLWHRVQDPSTDVELPCAPMMAVRSEMDDTERLNRNIFPKKPSEIIEYLKTHFPAWKDFDEGHLPLEVTNKRQQDLHKEITVVRALGKNLDNIRICNGKQIIFDNTPYVKTHELKENTEINLQNLNLPIITRTVDNIGNNSEIIENAKDKFINGDLDKPTNKVTQAKANENNGEDIKTYGNWKDSVTGVGLLDYNGVSSNIVNFPDDVMVELDDNAIPFIDDDMKRDNDMIQNDDDISLFDEVNDAPDGCDDKRNCYNSTIDSGFVNQSLNACSFMRLFLSELSASFKLIYRFIDDSIQEFRCDMIQEEDKKLLYNKANEAHLYVADIIGKLKRIIDREASENTKVKSLIINAGVEALTDKRMTRYRQVIMKCMEQAQLLEQALKAMVTLTNEHCAVAALGVDSADTHVPYFNIFE